MNSITSLFILFKKYKPADRLTDTHVIQALSEVHYDAETGNLLQRTISKDLISTLKLIGLFILLIACVNFINLSTAQSVTRSKEVGIRKVLGGNRLQLRLQFLSEASLITLAAMILALGVMWMSFPFVKNILAIPLELSVDLPFILFLISCSVAVILLSGIYPAFVLSAYNPVNALKAKVEAQSRSGIRK